MEQVEETGKKREWLFYLVILPLLFTVILVSILMMLMKINIGQAALTFGSQIPFVKQFIPHESKSPDTQNDTANSEKAKLAALQTDLQVKDQTIAQLESQLEAKKTGEKQLNQQIADLKQQLEEKRTTEQERQQQLAQLAELYGTMSTSKAVAMIEALSLNEQLQLLGAMPIDQQGQILQKMKPDEAAKLSFLLKEQVPNKDLDIRVLQDQIAQLQNEVSKLQANSVPLQDWAATFAAMPAKNAADILTNLYSSNAPRVLALMKQFNPGLRSAVLAQMDPALSANITNQLTK